MCVGISIIDIAHCSTAETGNAAAAVSVALLVLRNN